MRIRISSENLLIVYPENEAERIYLHRIYKKSTDIDTEWEFNLNSAVYQSGKIGVGSLSFGIRQRAN